MRFAGEVSGRATIWKAEGGSGRSSPRIVPPIHQEHLNSARPACRLDLPFKGRHAGTGSAHNLRRRPAPIHPPPRTDRAPAVLSESWRSPHIGKADRRP